MVEEKFLIDANSLITPYRRYYAFDLLPTFWDELSLKSKTGRLILLDIVKKEIKKGQDPLAEWLDNQNDFIICNHVTAEVIGQYQRVLQYIQTCGFYTEAAFNA